MTTRQYLVTITGVGNITDRAENVHTILTSRDHIAPATRVTVEALPVTADDAGAELEPDTDPLIGERVTIRGGFEDGIVGTVTATRQHCSHTYPVYTVTTDDGAELGGIAPINLEPDRSAFVAGRTNTARSIGDSDCVFRFTVSARSARFITLEPDGVHNRRAHRVGIVIRDGVECAYPLGRYSMAPVIRADRSEQ